MTSADITTTATANQDAPIAAKRLSKSQFAVLGALAAGLVWISALLMQPPVDVSARESQLEVPMVGP